MDKNAKKRLSMMLAAAMAASPLVMAPKAYAIYDVTVEAGDSDADEFTYYTITFTAEEDLIKGDTISVRFPEEYDLSEVDAGDIQVNGEYPEDDEVEIDDNTVTITLNDDIADEIERDDWQVEIEIDEVTNPDEENDYDIEVRTSEETTWEDDTVYIGDENDDDDDGDGDFSVDLGTDEAGEESSYDLWGIELKSGDKLAAGEWITVIFPDEDMLPRSISKSDVEIEGKHPTDIEIDDEKVELQIPTSLDGVDEFDIEFFEDAGIENPSEGDDNYVIEVEYDGRTYTSEEFEIVDEDAVPVEYSVTLSDYRAGARSSYTFEVDLGNEKLGANQQITIEFPAFGMVPSYMDSNTVTINGYSARAVSLSGNRVTLTTPYSFSSTSNPRIHFSWDSLLTNPQTTGSYTLSAIYDGKTYRSKSFTISGSVVANPVPVDNSTATLALTKSTPNVATGIQVGIKGVAVPLERNQDFFELALPAGFRVPATVNASGVTVNGLLPGFVTTRGQNLVIYPSQDIQAGTPVTLTIGEGTGIVTPAAGGMYSIGVFTSEEKNALFSRTVTVLPPNAARLKLNVASYTINGQTRALPAAPYTVNGNTLVPASFFKDALGLTVYWNQSQATIISGQTVIKFTVGSSQATINNAKVNIPAAVQAKNGVPMVPIRFVSDTLKFKLGWEAATSSIVIFK